MFYQNLLSLQVKRSAIISNKLGIYELPHELVNDLRLRIFGNLERPGKSQNFLELVPSRPPKIKVLLILAKKC